jgi:putative DNA primase/helicase
MSFHTKTAHAAKGKWRGIMLTFGFPEAALRNKHGPCPMCTSSDGFRFDDKDGSGSWICVCGSGLGTHLAMAYTGRDFRDVSSQIDGMVGNLKAEASPASSPTEPNRDYMRDTYRASFEVKPGDLVHEYLTRRGVEELIYPKALRFAPKLTDGEGGIRPAMLAMVGVNGQDKFVSMHRTFLKPDGSDKAEMASPRKMMAGSLPDGACVMLSEFNGGTLGIAEGIETAMSASALYNVPVWSAINTAMMRKWLPPEGCTELVVFGDNDPKFGGQAAAFDLAHRAALRGIATTVRMPDLVGEDFNDIWKRKRP